MMSLPFRQKAQKFFWWQRLSKQMTFWIGHVTLFRHVICTLCLLLNCFVAANVVILAGTFVEHLQGNSDWTILQILLQLGCPSPPWILQRTPSCPFPCKIWQTTPSLHSSCGINLRNEWLSTEGWFHISLPKPSSGIHRWSSRVLQASSWEFWHLQSFAMVGCSAFAIP